MGDYSQKEKAMDLLLQLSKMLALVFDCGVEARKNKLTWNDNPFQEPLARQKWYDGYSHEEHAEHSAKIS
jgi:hypothetical protein